ncbi:MAG: ABC transporter substrate-binding protein [Chloroflexota bacterium]
MWLSSVGVVAACAPSSPTNSGGASQKPPTESKAAAAAPAAQATGGRIKVRFWYGLGGQLGEVIVGQVAKFNASQERVEVEAVLQQSYNGVQEKFLATLVSNDVPELIQMEIHATPQFASSGALAPMEQFFKDDPTFNFDDLVPATLLNQRWDGILYAMPINRSTPLLYYNKSLFKSAGLDPEKPPKTWPELTELAKRLSSGEGDSRVHGFLPAADWWFFESMVWSAGGELMSKDVKKATFAKEGAQVMELWATMAHVDRSARVLTGETQADVRAQQFIDGRGVFLCNSTAGLGRFIRDVKQFDLGTAFMPHMPGFDHAVPTGGAAAAIPAKLPPERQRAAFEFVKWWISPEQDRFWSKNTGYFPVRKSSIESLEREGYYRDRPQFRTTIEQLRYAREAPISPQLPAVAKEITKGMEAILVDRADPVDAMVKAQQRAQSALDS